MTEPDPALEAAPDPATDNLLISPFFRPPDVIPTASTTPSIIHLKRDHHLPVTLKTDSPEIITTRFGDFPHSSFHNLPYGSQVRATAKTLRSRKRKQPAGDAEESAGAGFVHVLAPTPELWTASLPHRTQVVYTPDSSYILHRLGVVPGSIVVEAGAGSGSFSHAAARAVYNGEKKKRKGKVWSFEFHEERVGRLRAEIEGHLLEGWIEVVHRDVCKDGFLVGPEEDRRSPGATAVFLDLPAPWLALPHLIRHPRKSPSPFTSRSTSAADQSASASTPDPAETTISPLSTKHQIKVCTFSPCIEQVTRTISTLRSLGWVDIDMVEVAHERLEVRRQALRGYEDGAGPRTLSEALDRLKAVNDFRDLRRETQIATAKGEPTDKNQQLGFARGNPRRRPLGPDEGKLVTRSEQEVKTHTSYLVFATLPREWTDEDEANAVEMVKRISEGETKVVVGEKEKRWKGEERESKRAVKRREREEKKKRTGAEEYRERAEDEAVVEDDEKRESGENGEGSLLDKTADAMDVDD